MTGQNLEVALPNLEGKGNTDKKQKVRGGALLTLIFQMDFIQVTRLIAN